MPTLMYCHTALMMSGRVAVWMPRSRASLLVSLYWTGYELGQMGVRVVCAYMLEYTG